MLDALSPARRRLFLLAVVAAIVVVVVAAAVVVVDRTAPAADQDELGPVLLVSGYGGATRPLAPLREALEERGRDVVVVAPVGGGTGDVEEQARNLDREADDAMARFEAGSVDVVGYSAGGVVARSWVRDHGGAAKARRVMTLGSPHHGTSLAATAEGIAGSCSVACEQLQPDSSLLRRLNARDETPDGPRWISVWSRADDLVKPAESARLDGALNFPVQAVCPRARTSHGGLPGSRVVAATLVSALGTAAPRQPAGVIC